MKLDQKDFIKYSTAKTAFTKNEGTISMLVKQIESLKLKREYLYGRLELVTDDIVEKYGLADKNCNIEDDGTITEKT